MKQRIGRGVRPLADTVASPTAAHDGVAGDGHARNVPHPPFGEADHRLARRLRVNLYCQITEDHVSIDHIAKAWWIRVEKGTQTDPEQERVSRFLEYLARKEFSKRHKGIKKDYWSARPWAACALTGDGWIHSVMNANDHELVSLEEHIHQLCRDAHRTFEKAGRRGGGPRVAAADGDLAEIGEMLYSVLSRVIVTAAILEDRYATQQDRDDALRAVHAEWTTVRATVEGMIQRQARFEYFEGVGLGAIVLIPLLLVAGWLAARYGGAHFSDPVAFTAAIIGGAAGAVISVTQRMTAKTLVLDFAAPTYQKVALGALRPLIGAVFAAVVCFAVMGGLLAVEAKASTDASIALAFYAVVGFAAGFSERFATDVLEGASSKLAPAARVTTGAEAVESADPLALLLSQQTRHVPRRRHRTITPAGDRTKEPSPRERAEGDGHA